MTLESVKVNINRTQIPNRDGIEWRTRIFKGLPLATKQTIKRVNNAAQRMENGICDVYVTLISKIYKEFLQIR